MICITPRAPQTTIWQTPLAVLYPVILYK